MAQRLRNQGTSSPLDRRAVTEQGIYRLAPGPVDNVAYALALGIRVALVGAVATLIIGRVTRAYLPVAVF